MSGPRIVLLGAGGHAQGVLEAMLDSGQEPVAILDGPAAEQGLTLLGRAIDGPDELMSRVGATHFVLGAGSVGLPRLRLKLWEQALAAGLEPWTVISPRAFVSRWAQIGPGCAILPLAAVMPGASLGEGGIVNTGAVIEHDCQIGRFCHAATGARLAGAVSAGDFAHFGAGCAVIQGVKVGEGALIGAGAVVAKDAEAYTVFAGVPARPLRPNRPPEPAAAVQQPEPHDEH